MKVKIIAIRDAGNLRKERVVIKVTDSSDIGHYLLVKTVSRAGTITTGITDTFWFPDREVAVGDYVVLYTKRGTDTEKESNGTISHFFYWGRTEPIWNEPDHAVVLLQAKDWASLETKPPLEP
jgi:hypothetical protein